MSPPHPGDWVMWDGQTGVVLQLNGPSPLDGRPRIAIALDGSRRQVWHIVVTLVKVLERRRQEGRNH